MSRLDSGTLFFGPMIAQPPRLPSQSRRPHADASNGWTAISSPKTPSPRSSPSVERVWEEEDIFFGVGPPVATDASFFFNVTGSSPLTHSTRKVALPKKYKPRDSGVALSGSEEEEGEEEDEEDEASLRVATIPASSNSTSTVYSSDGDREALATPDVEPSLDSGWPATQCEPDSEEDDESFGKVDKFIMKTLVAGGKGRQDGGGIPHMDGAGDTVGGAWKKPPGTPVKRVKLRDLPGTERPWQSAVTKRVDSFGYDAAAGGTRKPPRKSLPAAFPISTKGASSPAPRKSKNMDDKENMPLSRCAVDGEDTDDEGLDSPSLRKEGRYSKGLMGLGRIADGKLSSSNWLIRRNSSGVYSTESEGSYSTPTKANKSAGLVNPSS
jgi:mitosis inhibitor protein kinase SWE1